MCACLCEEDLLRFLDGEMGAQDDAPVVVHVEECAGCQDRLERLTSGMPAPGKGLFFELMQIHRVRDGDPAGREAGLRGSTPVGEGTCRAWALGPDPHPTIAFVQNPRATRKLDDTVNAAEGDDRQDPVRVEDPSQRVLESTDPPVRGGQEAPRNRAAEGTSPPGIVAGYEILELLGEGGMAVVYKARHRGLNRLVALKMIRGGSQARPDYFTRFRVEAESVARLRDPNIIQIYDVGEAEGLPFVALELLDGGSLGGRIAGKPQPARQAAELVRTLGRAVQVAHKAGIIHRDLKPANILYTSDGVPKITDFGLAKCIDSDDGQTLAGQIMGSPSYMAPEQARGHSQSVESAADVYALGAMLYEMLVGRPPFKGETPMETMRQVIDDEPVPPSRRVPRVPRDLETICLKCLEKAPARRYGSARALVDDLRRYLDGEPIAARRTFAWERAVKWARRRPGAAFAGILALLVLVLAVAGLSARWESRAKRSQSIAAALDDGSGLEREADVARLPPEWRAAQLRISAFLPQLEGLRDDARVDVLHDRLAWKMVVLGSQISRYQLQQAQRDRLAAERQRFAEFRDLYNQAILGDTRFTELDLPGNEAAGRRAAAALDLYAAPGSRESWALGPLPEGLSASDRAEIADDCYELLLVLSHAETTPEVGLRRLDQAARLHPKATQAYHFRRASCLERVGDRQGAERARRVGETLEPSTAFDHYLAGRECFRRRVPTAALRHFDNALRERPEYFWAQCLSAVCWLQLRRPEAARAGFTACLKREPDFAWLYILRGFASGLAPPGAPPEEIRFRSDAAEADYRRALDLLERKPNPELLYAVLVNRGLLRSRRGDRNAAAADLNAAIQLGDHRALASTALAEIDREEGRYDRAIGRFSRAIERWPDWAPLYRGRADVVLAIEAPTATLRAQALSDLDRAIRLEEPDNPVLARDHSNRGWLLAAEGRDAEALAACESAIERVPDHADAHRLRLDLLRRLKRHDDVIRSCAILIARGKESAAIYERRGLARVETRDFPGAIEDFTRAVALGGDRPRLMRHRGWVYVVADAPRLAWQDFEEAIRLDPSGADAYNGRGAARLRLGEHRQAVADAERAVSLGGPTADLFYKAARVHALATAVVSAEARTNAQESLPLVTRYQDRAVGLLREAIRRIPADRRALFLKEVVLGDPDLRTIGRRVQSMNLAGPVPSPGMVADRPSP